MSPEEAIKVADQALYVKTCRHLTDTQRFILHESLLKKRYEEMQGYEPQHLKNEGAKLWKLLSDALGEKVGKSNFQAALKRRADAEPAIGQPILDTAISEIKLAEIVGIFLKRDLAVSEKDAQKFLSTQLYGEEIRDGASVGYIQCPKMVTSVLRISSRQSQFAVSICNPEPPIDDTYVVNVKESYEHDGGYSHSAYISYFLVRDGSKLKIESLKRTRGEQTQDRLPKKNNAARVVGSVQLDTLSDRRIKAYERLFYTVQNAASIVNELFDSDSLSVEEKKAVVSEAIFVVAEVTDSESFLLDEEVTIQAFGAFIGADEIFEAHDDESRQAEIDSFRKEIRTTYKMIASIRDTGKLDRTIRSPMIDYFRELRQAQDEKDKLY